MPPSTEEVDRVSGEVIETSPPEPGALLSPAARAEIDQQIATAKKYPRSLTKFKKNALALATLTEDTAASCIYALPRGGKPIEGPSVRLAEIVASSWGNFRVDSRIIDTDEKFITAEAAAWDLENNIAIRVQVRRRITDKHGKKYNDDMIGVTGNAAISIALRNAIFKVIPHALTQEIYGQAREVAIGNASTLAGNRAKMMEYFGKMGAPADRVLAAIGRAGIEDVTLDDLAILRGFASAIKSGETTVDQAFPDPKAQQQQAPKGAAGIADEVQRQAAEIAAKGGAGATDVEARRETIRQQAEQLKSGGAPDECSTQNPGCSQDLSDYSTGPDGKRRCANHAQPASGAATTSTEGKDASGSLPGMEPGTSSKPTRQRR
jgi:hypothetical protein